MRETTVSKTSPPDGAPDTGVDPVPAEPAVDTPPAETPTDVPADPQPTWGNWRYTGPPGCCYTSVPVTPEPGDVVECWGPPAGDGCWEATDAEPTRVPDNWRPDPTDEQHAKLRGDKTN